MIEPIKGVQVQEGIFQSTQETNKINELIQASNEQEKRNDRVEAAIKYLVGFSGNGDWRKLKLITDKINKTLKGE